MQVVIIRDENGEAAREFLKDTETIALYKSMRDLLQNLTRLDVIDTEFLLMEKLSKQVDGSEWSERNLDSLCWAIGSISGAMGKACSHL